MAPDPISTIAVYLQSDAGVSAITSNVYGVELPRSQQTGKVAISMPQTAIVVGPAGGTSNLGGGYLPFNDSRVDVSCYGATPLQSYQLWEAAAAALSGMRKQGRTIWARLAGGPHTLRDATTEWPLTRGSFQILALQPS